MKDILLSIVVPVYNVEKYITLCLDSIFNQSIDSDIYEVIVVDDGSPDNSLSIVKNFSKDHENLKIISQKNGGLSSARNVGLANALGQYIWFVDSDDTLTSNSIFDVCSIIDKHHPDVIATVLLNKDEETSKTTQEYSPNSIGIMSGTKYMLNNYPLGAIQRFIYNKDFLDENKLSFHLGVRHEDAEFGMKTISIAKTLYLHDKCVYVYLKREGGSIMSSWNVKSCYDLLIINEELRKYTINKFDKAFEAFFQLQIIKYTIEPIFAFSKNNFESHEFKEFFKKNKKRIRESILIVFSYKQKTVEYAKMLLLLLFPKKYSTIKKYLS